jgi:glutamate-1-semialdehyde 2,1-aminomutase
MSRFERSEQLHEQALGIFPGGVNSSLRAAERPVPLAFSHGHGSRITDVDGNEYIDYQLGQGALFLGHADPGLTGALKRQLDRGTHFAAQSEAELSAGQRLVGAVPSLDEVRFTNSATEAVIGALRLARAATGRKRIIRFEGHYHGWSDEGLAGFAPPRSDWLDDHYSRPSHPSAGVLLAAVDQFLVARFNDAEGLLQLGDVHDDVAAIVFEPVMCNTGCIAPEPGFVAALHEMRRRHGCLLIADETITGIRFGLAGAQMRFGIEPDLTVLGKAIGGGVPVAAFGGRAELMDLIARGIVGHAGTLNGNPLCMAAVDHVLERVTDDEIASVERLAADLAGQLQGLAERADLPLLVQRVGPVVYTAFCHADALRDYRDVVEETDPEQWTRLRLNLLEGGVRVLERGLWYLSLAHTEEDIQTTAAVAERTLMRISERAAT